MSEDSDYDYEMKSAHPLSPTIFDSKWRVKLYKLNFTGQWDDMGTGYVSIIKEGEDYFIKMFSETDNGKIFELKITYDIEFHRQRGTILTWKGKEDEEDDDSAISFQEKEGVQEVWKFICYIKGKEYQEEVCEYEEDDEESLPDPTLENLSYIAREIRMENHTSRVVRIVERLNSENGLYIKKLGELLENEEKKLEEKKSEITKKTDETDNKEIEPKNISQFEHLSLIFTIFKNILYIADQNLIELLVSDDLYLITFGALEYDFESIKIIKHRHFFKEQVAFNNLLDITNKQILQKIHMNHRLTYLRDTATGRFIEEITIKNINVIIHYNNSDIIQYFLSNEILLKNMIDKIKDDDLEVRHQGISFLLELISCCKDVIPSRVCFFETLCEMKIIEVLQNILIENEKQSSKSFTFKSDNSINESIGSVKQENEEKIEVKEKIEEKNIKSDIFKAEEYNCQNDILEKIRIKSIEILINILTLTPNYFKNYLTSKSQKNTDHPLLDILCNILLYHDNFGIKYEISELIKSLLDNEIFEKKNEIYEIFLNKCLKKLTDYLNTVIDGELTNKYKTRSTKQIVVEIICHCLKSHGQRFKYWAIHNDLIPNVFDIIRDQEKILDLQVVKFVKSIITNYDENLIKILISNNCFKKIIELFESNREKKNLVFSATLDLFDFINKNTMKKIIIHLFDNFSDFLKCDKNKEYFKRLIEKYNQGLDSFSTFRASNNDEKSKYQFWNRRELSAREDEDYFCEDEDDIFKDEQIIQNLENVTAKYEEKKLFESIEAAKAAQFEREENKIINNILKSKIDLDRNEDNLALITEFAQNNQESPQLLKRKKLSDEEDNKSPYDE